MGIIFSCSGDDELDEGFETFIMRSLSFDGDDVKSTLRSLSFNGRDAEPAILKAFGSGKLIIEGSVSFKREDTDPFQLETKISIKSPTSEIENPMKASYKPSRFSPSNERAMESPMIQPDWPQHKAAVKLQKVYKSFRTRRQLADCAVLVEQRWWKLLDFALLKRSSVSFFGIEEPESVVSRWLRARRRAATVGKGLSKDEKAQKLALRHWLEAIDPRHRYGHNLHFYYDCWLHCASKQPFFYWLDVGEGKDVNLEDKCSRSKLQQQCIKYLGPKEREDYEVIVEDGKFYYKQSRKILDSSEDSRDTKWIFVLSTSKNLYVGQKKKGNFQHSSFLAGGATSAAGRLVIENGILKAVWPHSGHYRPTEENFQEFMSFLKEKRVDLTDVKLSPTEGDEEMLGFRSCSSEPDLTQKNICPEPDTQIQTSQAYGGTTNTLIPKSSSSFESFNGVSCNITSSTEPNLKRDGSVKRAFNLEQYRRLHKNIMLKNQEESDNEADEKSNCFLESKRSNSTERSNEHECNRGADSQSVGCGIVDDSSVSEGHYMFCKQNLFSEEQEEDEEASIPQELILHRINSKKGLESYQLGRQLSCKWTTGAGPRIGCVRDYPSELQFRALEQVNLSPRSTRPYSSPRPSPPILPIQNPRMTEVPLLRKVPLLQKPNIHR